MGSIISFFAILDYSTHEKQDKTPAYEIVLS